MKRRYNSLWAGCRTCKVSSWITTAKFITAGKQLNYRQHLDECTICHSGKDNCIDSHMPNQPSDVIYFHLPGERQRQSLLYRNHRIAIYDKTTVK